MISTFFAFLSSITLFKGARKRGWDNYFKRGDGRKTLRMNRCKTWPSSWIGHEFDPKTII